MLKNPAKYLAAASAFILLAGIGPVRAETLESAVVTALNQHPSVLAALANRDAVTQERRAERSGYFPQLNVNAGAGRIYGDNATSRGLSVTRGAGYSWMGEGGVTLTQLIYDHFGTSNRVDAAGARAESAAFTIMDTREDLALRAALAYLDVLRGEENVALLKNHDTLLADYIGRIADMVKQGAAEESLLVQAQDIRAQLERTRIETQGALAQARADYNEMIGTMPSPPMARPVVKADLIPARVEDAIAYAAENHPRLKSAQGQIDSYYYDAQAQRSVLIPKFTGELSYYEKDQDDVIGGELADGRALVRMNWDYSLGGAERARIREAQFRHEESKAMFAEQGRAVENMIRKSYAQLEQSTAEGEIVKERLGLNEKLLSNNKAQFEGARMNIFQVLQAENNLFNAKMAGMNAEYKILAGQYAVLASMGRLQHALNIAPTTDYITGEPAAAPAIVPVSAPPAPQVDERASLDPSLPASQPAISREVAAQQERAISAVTEKEASAAPAQQAQERASNGRIIDGVYVQNAPGVQAASEE